MKKISFLLTFCFLTVFSFASDKMSYAILNHLLLNGKVQRKLKVIPGTVNIQKGLLIINNGELVEENFHLI